MSIIEDLLPKSEAMSRLWRGTIANNPTAVTQFVEVIITDIPVAPKESPLRWKQCRWQPRYAVQQVNVAESSESVHNVPIPQLLLPKRGDVCLCVFDNRRELWVVMYWPY